MHAFIHWALLRMPSGLFSPPSDHGLVFPRYPEVVHSVAVRWMKRKSASKNSDRAFILLTAKNIQRVFAFLFGVISVAQMNSSAKMCIKLFIIRWVPEMLTCERRA